MRPREANKGAQPTRIVFRVFSDEAKRIKHSASAANQSISDYIRRILSDAVRPPIVLQLPSTLSDDLTDSEESKIAGRAPESNSKRTVKRCKIHNLPMHQCSSCNNIGA